MAEDENTRGSSGSAATVKRFERPTPQKRINESQASLTGGRELRYSDFVVDTKAAGFISLADCRVPETREEFFREAFEAAERVRLEAQTLPHYDLTPYLSK